MNYGQIVSFTWGVADLIRDTFKRGKYQDVILPLTVLRRLDCVLAPTKEKVLQRQAELRGRGLENLRRQLCDASGFEFYNTSRYDFERLLADAPNVAANLRNYIAGFSENMRRSWRGSTLTIPSANSMSQAFCFRCWNDSGAWIFIPTLSTTPPWALSSRS